MFRHSSRVSIEPYATDRWPSAMATPLDYERGGGRPEAQVKRILRPATKGGAPGAAVKTLIGATAKSGLGTN